MRLKSNNFFKSFSTLRGPSSLGKWLSVGLVSSLFLAGCVSDDVEVPFGQVGFVSGFYGAVSGDEPASVLIGRDILTAGGNAADAAVAMTFSMAVTYQSEVSLGAGGMCVVHNGQAGTTEVLDFFGRAASGTTGRYEVAIPGLVRGMAALNLQYGNLDWRELLVPAERQARFGHRLSRAQDRKIQAHKSKLAQDIESRRKLADGNGRVFREGQKVSNAELAVVMGRIRLGGAGQFYVGEYARNIVRAAQANGANLTLQDLQRFLPEWRAPISVTMDTDILMTTPAPTLGGKTLAGMTAYHFEDARYEDLENNEVSKAALRLKALETSLGKAPQSLGGDAGAGFLVVDQDGMAVVCNLGLNGHFGTGQMIPELGFYLAEAPDQDDANAYAFGPAVIARGELRGAFLYASVASGGAAGAQILSQVLAEELLNSEGTDTLSDIVAKPRMAITAPGVVTAEVDISRDLVKAAQTAGYQVQRGDLGVQVHAVHCPFTLPAEEEDEAFCVVANDPRGHGLSESLAPSGN